MSRKKYELDLISFWKPSPIPMEVRMRLALNKMGMKFADDGKPSAIINRNPTPLGKCTMWEDFEYPYICHYIQELDDGEEEQCLQKRSA